MRTSFTHIGKVISLLSKRERQRLRLVILFAIVLAIIEVVGVGSIMPFMAVASNPGMIHENSYLSVAYEFFRFANVQSFLVALGVLMLLFVLLRSAAQAGLQYIKMRFTSMRRYTLSMKLFKSYLGQDYPFFLNRNSYEFIKNINTEIEQMISGTLMQYVDVVAYIIQVFLLICFLFFINPLSTLGIAVAIIFIYGMIYFFIRKVLKRLGTERFTLNTERNRIVSEAFWGIKEIKIAGNEKSFIDSLVSPMRRLALNASTQEVIGDIPKHVLESVAFGSIIVFILHMILQAGNFQSAAATVSLYAYAGYRLMPAVQNVFKAVSKLKYSAPAAERMCAEFASVSEGITFSNKAIPRMEFSNELRIQNISFMYPSSDRDVLEDIDFAIKANTLIGFAGKTGSGKTTLVDIILGLLYPRTGSLSVDGTDLTPENIRSWQQNLGYVPQNIYLSNDTISSNIAFGVPPDKIDHEAVKYAARLAQLDDFIVGELPLKYDTKIGERGVRLSGGQRQRIGIARALYRNPSILVMDEATSALDNQTELAVMDAIDGLSGKKTIILIAHRLTTLKKCDIIYCLERGKIVQKGTYEELYAN